MKKNNIISTTVLAIMLVISSFAFAKPVENEAKQNFNKHFKHATNISWQKVGDKEKVCFTLDGRSICAYYTTDGKLVSVSRNILSTELPISLSMELKEKYKDFWITNLNEVANDEGTTYYITLENADNEIVLKSTNISEWNVFHKFKKY